MATIKDVARLAGVGVGTASRVISGKGSFSPEAAEKVREAAKQLEFRPSATARALSLKSTGTIGVYVPDFKGPFYGPLLHAIDTELRRHGRHMVAANGCGDDDERQQALDGMRFLIERDCDGIIVIGNGPKDADFLEIRKSFPRIAVVNRDVKGMKSQCFTVDHHAAGAVAAHALVEHGHRRIALISGPPAAGDNRDRLQGFFTALSAHGIARESVGIQPGDFTAESGWDATEQILKRHKTITAIFCANDQMAMGCLSHLHHAGVAVPKQISVVGYDDVDVAAYLSPRLTSVHIPLADMALNACRRMLNTCYQLNLPVSQQFVPSLSLRDSMGPSRTASPAR